MSSGRGTLPEPELESVHWFSAIGVSSGAVAETLVCNWIDGSSTPPGAPSLLLLLASVTSFALYLSELQPCV